MKSFIHWGTFAGVLIGLIYYPEGYPIFITALFFSALIHLKGLPDERT